MWTPRATVLVLAILVAACNSKPPIQVSAAADNCLDFDLQKLGEYSTLVNRLEIVDPESGVVLWSAIPVPGKAPRVALLRVCRGPNPRRPLLYGDADDLQYLVYEDGESFEMIEGKQYSFRVISPEHRNPGNVGFSFPSGTEP